MSKQEIMAHLHLFAVLPRLGDLARVDDEARTLVAGMNLTIHFNVLAGPSLFLKFSGGKVTASDRKQGRTDVAFLFTSCEKLNRMMMGEKVIPILYKGFTKLGQLKKFMRISDILPEYLKPEDSKLADPAFKAKHVELLLLTALAGAAQIAGHDPKMKKTADKLPTGTIQYEVNPDGPYAHVYVNSKDDIRVAPGKLDAPTATLEINGGIDMAADLLADKLDTFAALGAGDLRATGLLPLADEFNAMLDRVGVFLD